MKRFLIGKLTLLGLATPLNTVYKGAASARFQRLLIRHWAGLVLILIPLFAQAQLQNQSDSLQTALAQTQPDTSRVKILNNLAFAYFSRDPKKAALYTTQSLQLANKIGYQPGALQALYIKGIIAEVTGNYLAALKNDSLLVIDP